MRPLPALLTRCHACEPAQTERAFRPRLCVRWASMRTQPQRHRFLRLYGWWEAEPLTTNSPGRGVDRPSKQPTDPSPLAAERSHRTEALVPVPVTAQRRGGEAAREMTLATLPAPT